MGQLQYEQTTLERCSPPTFGNAVRWPTTHPVGEYSPADPPTAVNTVGQLPICPAEKVLWEHQDHLLMVVIIVVVEQCMKQKMRSQVVADVTLVKFVVVADVVEKLKKR